MGSLMADKVRPIGSGKVAHIRSMSIFMHKYLEFYHFQKISFEINGLGFSTLERKPNKINGLAKIGKTREYQFGI